MRSKLLVLLSLSGLTGRVKKLYKKGDTKKYYIINLILYVEKKDFEISRVKVLQPDIETIAIIIGDHKEGKPGARALILQLR